MEHHGQRARESDCFFRSERKQNVSVVNDSFSLSVVGTEVGGVLGSVEANRLELNLIRRSSLTRARSVSCDGGCCNCFDLLEQNFT